MVAMNRRQRRQTRKAERVKYGFRADPARLLAAGMKDLEAGRPAAAAKALHSLLLDRPDNADALHLAGLAAHRLGDDERALALVRKAAVLQPGQPQIHYNLAEIQRSMDLIEPAIAAYRRAAELAPETPHPLHRLGTALLESGENREARKALEAAVRAAPGDAGYLCDLGRCLEALGDGRRAEGRYRAAIHANPTLAAAHYNLGVTLQNLGRFDEAADCHRRALVLQPTLADAWYSLSMNDSADISGAELDRMNHLLDGKSLEPGAEATIRFALARTLDRRDELAAACAHYRQANAIRARILPFDADRHMAYIERLIRTCDKRFFDRRRNLGSVSERPVFIVGMPRSGSTLVERILAGHPHIAAAGEHDAVRRIVRRLPGLGRGAAFPECLADIDSRTIDGLAQSYLHSLPETDAATPRMTDKMLGNFLRLGLIAIMFPNARVIHCRRDGRDVATSCYLTNFANGLRFTYDPAAFAVALRAHERLMAHWRAALPLPILEVRYEDIVADMENQSRRMVKHCGLDWDEGCLDFHGREAGVKTASFWQVRQPLYASSVGRWRRYREHLGALWEAREINS